MEKTEAEKMTELKKDPSYRYVEELVYAFENAGVCGEPMELPMTAIMLYPLPHYMPVAAAVKTKFLFLMALYQNSGRWGAMQDAIPGILNMINCVMEDKRR